MKKEATKIISGNAGQGTRISLLTSFFNGQLNDIYQAEKQLVKALPKMKKAASSDKLVLFFEEHLAETKQHIVRLEKLFELIGIKPYSKKSNAMEGLLREAVTIAAETQEGSATRDAALIFISRKIEHYEIACYGSLHQLALTLGMDPVADLLISTLNEEKDADEALSTLAITDVNLDALEEV
jgi:ferritin-like metal-binding protein YciE